jgi:uncharacterized repeat protein (TIGR04138 family)
MPDKHLSAAELCRLLLAAGRQYYGDQFGEKFREWRLTSSERVGDMVYGCIAEKLLTAHPVDQRSDFDGVFAEDEFD